MIKGLLIERTMSGPVARSWFPEIIGLSRIPWLIGFAKRATHQIAVEKSRPQLVEFDAEDGVVSEVHFPAVLVSGPANGSCGHLWLVDRRRRLCFLRQPAFDPDKLGSIHGGQLHH